MAQGFITAAVHALLGGTHSDTATQAVARGALVYGNTTPNWDGLGIGAANRLLRSDGTDPSWAQVALATDVAGDLPLANLAQASAASRLLGRGSAAGAGDFQEITVGSGLSISGTALDTAVTLASGTYTPTLTNGVNVGASTAYQCQYLRVGSTVTVSGRVDIDPTSASTQTILSMSLPVASNIGATEDVGGTFNTPQVEQGGGIYGASVTDTAEFEFVPASASNLANYFTFTYQVI